MTFLKNYDTTNGYYLYNNKPYYSRESAFQDMIKNEDYDSEISFYFHDELFEKIDWKEKIPASLSGLYRIRAFQLRQKYDYLILSFSGGSDSTQMLISFLKNGIFLDEIQVCHHQKAISKLDRNMMENDYELKQFLEYEKACLPMLKVVKELSPNTKITTIDLSDFLYEQTIGGKFENIGMNSKEIKNSSALASKMPRSFSYYMLEYNSKHTNKSNACIVRGLEKPSLKLSENDRLVYRFFDTIYHGMVDFNLGKMDKFIALENFYWSKDLPLLTIKQIQIIKNELQTNKQFYEDFKRLQKEIEQYNKNSSLMLTHSPAFILERMYNKLIYPDWNLNTYVAGKPRLLNPEYKLASLAMGDHHGNEAVAEFKDYKFKKYDKIKNKAQFVNHIFTKNFDLGGLNIKW